VKSAANTCTNLQPHAARDPGNAWSPITNPCGRTVLQERLGQTAVRASFGTTPKMHVLLGNTDAALVAVLTLLQDALNLPFKTSYAGRLGNFEVFHLNSWLNRPQPFLIATRRDSIKNCAGPQVMEICRTRQFAAVEHKAHAVGTVAGKFARAVSLGRWDIQLFERIGKSFMSNAGIHCRPNN
jgi:hypothetical protein